MTPRRRHGPARRHRIARRHPGRRLPAAECDASRRIAGLPPAPPVKLTPLVACDPATEPEILWHIATYAPQLRRWLVANPAATAELLEYVSQQGGPGVKEALELLFASYDEYRRP